MVLDRTLNTILQTSGSFVSFRPVDAPRDGSSEDGVEEFAAMISKFVHTSGGLVQDLDTEVRTQYLKLDSFNCRIHANRWQDDVKLLRLRTKKHELVIVPDAKYIFVVVHDTPPA